MKSDNATPFFINYQTYSPVLDNEYNKPRSSFFMFPFKKKLASPESQCNQ